MERTLARPARRPELTSFCCAGRLVAMAVATAATIASVPAAVAQSGAVVAIVGGHIHTSGPAGEIAVGTVLIRDGRIEAVGADVAVPARARVVDAKGAVVTAGFVAADTGLAATEVGRDADAAELDALTAGPGDGTRDLQTQSNDFTAAFDVQYALNPDSTLLALARLAGITRAIVVPGYGGGRAGPRQALFAGQAAAIQLGEVGPMLVRPHAAMVLDLGEAGAEHTGDSRNTTVLALKEALAEVRRYQRDRAAFERNQARPFKLSVADLQALVPVVQGRMPVLVSAQRAADIRLALALAREEHLKIILDGADEGWRVAGEIAQAQVPVIIDPTDDLPASFERMASTMDNAARLQAAGVQLVIASSAENYRVRELRYLAGNAVAYGLPWPAALAAVTINPARVFGISATAGSIEVGKDADVVVWSGDPFEPLSQPLAVFIKGQPQPLNSRQLQLRDRYQDLHRPYPPQYH